MRTIALTPLLSILMLTACGTTPENVPSDASDDAGDASPDSTADTSPDASCTGRYPSESCMDWGCPAGQDCVETDGGCAPSHCSCSDGAWQCTADCGPAFECVPGATGCPAEQPSGGSCDTVGLYCEWGSECCCGECSGSEFCTCTESGWACGATDACMIPTCDGRTCDDDTDCEGGGAALACVGGVCARSSGWSTGPEIAIVTDCEPFEGDSFELVSATIDSGAIDATVAFGGGCAEHTFRVCWDGSFMESFPVQVRLVLQHDGHHDPCDAYPSQHLRIPLGPIGDAYTESYGAGDATVRVNFESAALDYHVGPCADVELPPCPADCELGAFERCGSACDPATDAACGNEIGDGMECVGGSWQCTIHPPLGMGCNLVCRR